MLSFEEAGRILDEAADALPEGIFDGLNGGVNLLPEAKRGEDGRYIMGLYHHDGMGRYIEIFYGSFLALYPDAPDAEVAEELRKTLRHELTHHVENKAWDRTLEKWDEEQTRLWEEACGAAPPLRADRVLFVDEDCTLSLRADALFRAECQACGLKTQSGWAAAKDVTAALLGEYDAALCMTLAQADALAARFPEFDEQILCLGEKDIPGGAGAEKALRRETAYLAEELLAETER